MQYGKPEAIIPRLAERQPRLESEEAEGNNQGGSLGKWTDADRAKGRNTKRGATIASQPYSGAHFATMPPGLAERCIKAGCPAGGHVLDPFFWSWDNRFSG